MSLITRCPACGTMFKVVTDQLKVSQGWVRCGHCAEVFDASLHMQEAAQAPAAPAQQPPEPPLQTYTAPSPVPVAPPLPASGPVLSDPGSPDAFLADRSIVQADSGSGEFDPAGWKQQHAPKLDEAGSLRLNDEGEAVRSEPVQAQLAKEAQTADSYELPDFRAEAPLSEPPQDEPDEADEVSNDVSFVRDARRKAFWHKPAVRVTLGLVGLLLAVVLLLQVLVQQRDSVAAMAPAFRPWLQAMCGHLHCEVKPLRRIEALVIDSSSFNKIDADSYRLGFSLKNTGTVPVAMPALEVTLTDTQEQALVRRVLMPAQFGAENPTLAAGAEFAGLVLMQVPAADAPGAASPLRIAGYRVLAFYP
ncbi:MULTISPECIES: DUF3426 domain-containing protein [Polaromonas]|uniref:DUF3426 domain-containing protein n=1 Tax=Polaromonas aquatica TaxID=332657 RepID=A0ABW1U0A5_9BURK